MSIVDKVIAAVTPAESAEDRAKARTRAMALAAPGSWLQKVLDHHLAIESAFAAVRQAPEATSRRVAHERLAMLITAHSIAEEGVLYPALALNGEKAHSTTAYAEQSATKVQMAALEELDPMTEDYVDKLEHIRGAVAHHVYEEEGTWFIELHDKTDALVQARLGQRYDEEFARYASGAAPARGRQPG